MSAAAAMRLTQLHGEPKPTLAGLAHARDGTEVPYCHGLIRRLMTVTDPEAVVLSSGACTGMPPAVGCPVTCLDDVGGSSRAALAIGLGGEGSRHYPVPSQRVTMLAAAGQSLMPRPRTLR